MLLSESYREQLKLLHKKSKHFGAGSKRRADRIKSLGYTDILDYGCGKGYLRIDGIKRYDPAIDEFSALPEPADLIVCTDMLEHVEPECLDDVLSHMQSLMLKAGFFTIGTKPAKKKLPDGRNAHLIIQRHDWWIKKLNEYFHITGWQMLEDGIKKKENKELEVTVVKKCAPL